MSSRDSYPESLVSQAKELYFCYSAPFEKDFDPRGYTGTFKLPVRANQAVFADNSIGNIYATGLLERKLDDSRCWEASIGYVVEDAKLGLMSLTMPLEGGDDSLVLKRREADRSDEFVILHRTPTRRSPDNPLGVVDELATAVTLPASQVVKTFAQAGFGIPQLVTENDNLRLQLAAVKDDSYGWAATEMKIVQNDPDARATLIRHASRFRRRATDESTIDLTVLWDNYDDDRSLRDQLEIVFKAVNHFVEMPQITYRTYLVAGPTSDRDTNPTNSAEVAKKQLKITPKLLFILLENARYTLS